MLRRLKQLDLHAADPLASRAPVLLTGACRAVPTEFYVYKPVRRQRSAANQSA
jgi:hypothetical protein